LGPKIGAQNPRQVISELRRQGFEGIIETRRFTIIDQDGKRCHPGEYHIPQESKLIAEETLKEHIAQKSSTTLDANQKHNPTKNIRRS
jgi:hypothetical protein